MGGFAHHMHHDVKKKNKKLKKQQQQQKYINTIKIKKTKTQERLDEAYLSELRWMLLKSQAVSQPGRPAGRSHAVSTNAVQRM